ncbi:MFS transporter [Streptomyces noursei]|uniref:MFS transporter n=1 Tax=Streptomyces noursei TaxID=1971 RepID=UPI00362F3655
MLGSLASGLSWNVESLIVFRVAQGFGGGMLDLIMPTVLATAAGPALAGRVIGPAGTRLRRPGLRAVAGHRKRPARPHCPHPGDAARVMLFSLLFLVPLYQQRVRGHEVLAAGMLLPPLGIGSFLAMPVAGRISDLMGARRLAPLGGLLVALSAFAYPQANARTDEVLLGLVAFVTGVGLGLIGAPTMGALYRTLPQDADPKAPRPSTSSTSSAPHSAPPCPPSYSKARPTPAAPRWPPSNTPHGGYSPRPSPFCSPASSYPARKPP